MLNTIDYISILAYIIIVVYVGIKFKDKANKSFSDFFVGGRKFPWWLAGLSMVATTFAADTPLAVTEYVRKSGISGNWIWWNFLIGGMLTTFFFAKLWRRSEVLTEIEFIKIRYSGKKANFLRILKSLYFGIFMNSLVIGWVNIAMLSIISGFFNVDLKTSYLILISLMGISLFYSALSGIWGVAITDAIQFFIAFGGTVILAVFVINSDQINGIEGLKQLLANNESLSFLPKINQNNASEVLTISVGALLAYGLVQWWASWYPGAEPGGGSYVVQRMLSTKNEKHSLLATLFFQIANYILRPFPWILVGLATIILYPELTKETYKLGYVYAMRDYLPNGFKGLLLVAFAAAYMSTISTQLNYGSSILTNDFFFVITKKKFNEKTKIFVGKIFTVLVALLSLYVTTIFNSISNVWEFVIQCGAGLGFVLIMRWYWWRINAWSEITATLIPFVLYFLSKNILNLEFPNSYFFTVGGTITITLAITFLTKPTEYETLKTFYNKVKPQGFWKIFNQNSIDLNLIFAWLSSIVFLYATLFLVGKIIFHYWLEALISFVIAILGLISMLYFSKKAKVFE